MKVLNHLPLSNELPHPHLLRPQEQSRVNRSSQRLNRVRDLPPQPLRRLLAPRGSLRRRRRQRRRPPPAAPLETTEGPPLPSLHSRAEAHPPTGNAAAAAFAAASNFLLVPPLKNAGEGLLPGGGVGLAIPTTARTPVG